MGWGWGNCQDLLKNNWVLEAMLNSLRRFFLPVWRCCFSSIGSDYHKSRFKPVLLKTGQCTLCGRTHLWVFLPFWNRNILLQSDHFIPLVFYSHCCIRHPLCLWILNAVRFTRRHLSKMYPRNPWIVQVQPLRTCGMLHYTDVSYLLSAGRWYMFLILNEAAKNYHSKTRY